MINTRFWREERTTCHALLQGSGYAGEDLQVIAGLAPGSGPSCCQILFCSQLNHQLLGHWGFLFNKSTTGTSTNACLCFPACFISSLIKLPVIVRLEEMISVFINEGVTWSWAEHLVDAVCVAQLGPSQMPFCCPPALSHPEQTVCSV